MEATIGGAPHSLPAGRAGGAANKRRLVVAAPDKFRGSASAAEVAAAIAGAARGHGADALLRPLADGGEGLLDAVQASLGGGVLQQATVRGPLGAAVGATWLALEDTRHRLGATTADVAGAANQHPARARRAELETAIVEMAAAAGRHLVRPEPEVALAATTYGVGELIAAALGSGARGVVVGCGGSATTDGGSGALQALDEAGLLRDGRLVARDGGEPELVVATDVTTSFLDAARVFAPQKGASPAGVVLLERRLRDLADGYLRRFGVDVTLLERAGAAGGLAGGLAAAGGHLVSGFDLTADLVGLGPALSDADDVVVTGEGRLDETSLAGKVVAGVVRAARPRSSVLVVAGVVSGVGRSDLAALGRRPASSVAVVALADRFGLERSFAHTAACVAEVVSDYLARAGTLPEHAAGRGPA